jgi:hypothetical protein
MKLFLRFLLSLCVLLLAGNANPGQSRIAYLPGGILERSVSTNYFILHYDRVFSNAPDSKRNRFFEKIKAAEVDDDDQLKVCKKSFTSYCISFLYTQPSDYCCRYYNSSLPFRKHFSLTSTCKFIIHRVIRI